MVAHFGVAINYAYTGSIALFVFLLGAYLSTQRSGQGKQRHLAIIQRLTQAWLYGQKLLLLVVEIIFCGSIPSLNALTLSRYNCVVCDLHAK
jgi:hypothetical protein